jgi:UDP-glucose 4-epimerase
MRCLVLGGSGFIGSHLCDELLANNYEVRVLDMGITQSLIPLSTLVNLEWYEGDFSDPQMLQKALAGCDVVFHLICTTTPKTSNDNPIYDLESNVSSTLQLLETIKNKGVKIIFLSSGGTVYGVPEKIPITETHPTNPICSYGITKLCIEKYLYFYHKMYGLNYITLRLSNPFGERQRFTNAQGAIAHFLHRAIHRKSIEIWGNGEIIRDYVYIKDVVKALVSSVEYEGNSKIFNIGNGIGKSLNSLIKDIEKLLGYEVNKQYFRARNFDISSNVLDISLAKKELSWFPNTNFRDGLSKMADWIETSCSLTRL